MPRPIPIDGWSGGINQKFTPKDIADNELQDARNVYLTDTNAIRRRPGVSYTYSGGGEGGVGVHRFKQSNGTEAVIIAKANGDITARIPGDPGAESAYVVVDADGGGSHVNPGLLTEVDFAEMDDTLVITTGNDGGTYANPIVIDNPFGTGGDSSAWTGTFPTNPKHCAVWNRRLWLTEGNVLYGSALGDITNFSDTGGSGRFQESVGDDETEDIVGIVPFYDRLIVFKHSRIYQVQAGSPAVDANQYEIKNISRSIGTVDVKTVKEVLNDLLFLSDYGVLSLQAVAQYGDFAKARLSAKIPALSGISTLASPAAAVLPDKEQYWLAVPSSTSVDYNDNVWVLDFSDPQNMPWMLYDGGIACDDYAVVNQTGYHQVYGVNATDALMVDEDRWDDVNTATRTPTGFYFKTKSFDLGESAMRKEFLKVGFQMVAITEPVDFDITWILNEDPVRTKTVSGSFTASITGSELDDATDALLWNDALTTGTFLLATDAPADADILWGIRGTAGRRGQTINFKFSVSSSTQGWEVRRMLLVARLLESLSKLSDNSGVT